MKTVFADTLYWIAIVRPNDSWAERARIAKGSLGNAILVTTDEVLAELLAHFSKGGPLLRQAAVRMVRQILAHPNVRVVAQTRDSFLAGLQRYDNRPDKDYSLTDCISMNVMEAEGISEILTNDHHFEQERFVVLIGDRGNRSPGV